MKKRIAIVAVGLAAAVGTGYAAYPDEFTHATDAAARAVARLWDNIEANPVPMILALGTFLVTVVYHKAKGKSLRESVEAAATRVTVVAPTKETENEETAVVRRAKARATRTQLLADKFAVENRHRKLPEEIQKAEREACYTEQAVGEAEQKLAEAEQKMDAKLTANEEARAKVESLRKAKTDVDGELAAIEAELQKLVELV